jgi:hypothetical protein
MHFPVISSPSMLSTFLRIGHALPAVTACSGAATSLYAQLIAEPTQYALNANVGPRSASTTAAD